LSTFSILTSRKAKDQAEAWSQNNIAFMAGAFLVSVPVFFQAPLVRFAPALSLVLTLFWMLSSIYLLKRKQDLWGSLLFGFTLSWWCGTLYWGWLRTNPYLHLPVEALGVPIALLALAFPRLRIGGLFFLGSFIGTALTDVYIFGAGLPEWWIQMMQNEQGNIAPIMQGALGQMNTPLSFAWAGVIVSSLLLIGLLGLRSDKPQWWAFSGAVLNTLVVNGIFLLGAMMI